MDWFAAELSDDEDVQEEWGSHSKEQVVFLIDAQSSMCKPADLPDEDLEGCTWVQVACRAAALVLRRKIIESERDEAAVVFYNTANKSSDLAGRSDDLYIFMGLAEPDADRIKRLERLSMSKFEKEIGSGRAVASNIKGVLSLAADLMEKKNPKVSHRVIVFTNDSVPATEGQAMKSIRTSVQTMRSNRVALQLFPMVPVDVPFDVDTFWKPLLDTARSTGEVDLEEDEQVGKLDSLRLATRSKLHKKRALSSIRWRIGLGEDQMELGVKLYALLQPAGKAKTEKVSRETAQLVKASTAVVDYETGTVLSCKDVEGGVDETVLTFFPNTGASGFKYARLPKVYVTRGAVAALKKVDDPGLRLLGFKPLAALKDYHQLRNPTFVYPDEKGISGSTAAFIALHQTLLDRGAFALCTYQRLHSEPKMVALVPQQESRDQYAKQVEPPGFNMIYLPFADSIRYPEACQQYTGAPVTGDLEHTIAAAEEMLAELGLDDFDSTFVPNPQLQRHYEVLEALALREEPPDVEDLEDSTLPLLDEAAPHIQKFKDVVYGPGYNEDIHPPEKKKGGAKRKTADPADAAQLKEEVEQLDIQGRRAKGTLDKLSNAQLQQALRHYGLPVSGKKSELVVRIENHLSKQAA